MLLQTNSYIVPRDKRSEHARLLRKFRQTLHRLGCDQFEVYEQVGANWAAGESTGRFVQILRFRDRKHQQEVQAAEKRDAAAQQLIADFCALINFPYQQQQGLFAVGFYTTALQPPVTRVAPQVQQAPAAAAAAAQPAPVASATTEPAPPPTVPQEGEAEGSSLLDFTAMAPATPPAPLRLAAPADDASQPEPAPSGSNGEHSDDASSSSEDPEAMLDLVQEADSEEVLDEHDREAILGELTGDDVPDDHQRQKTEG